MFRKQWGGQYEVNIAGRDGVIGHARIPGRGRILRQGRAPCCLDLLHTLGTIGGRARKDDGDGAGLAVLGERTEKQVDGEVGTGRRTRGQPEGPALQGHVLVGRDHVDGIGREDQAIGRLDDQHDRLPGEQFR